VLSKFLEVLYNKVFVNIVVNKQNVTVEIEICSTKGVLESVEEVFEASYINEKMISFIRSYTAESPYYYISVLDISAYQGVIPSCEKNKLSYYHDLSESEYKCYDKKWTYYTSKTDLYEIEKIYKDIGVDFIFSPFNIIYKFFHDKLQDHMALFVLIQENFVALCVFENSELVFGQYLDMENSAESDDLLLDSVEDELDDDSFDFDLDEGIDLEDVDVIDDIESTEDFGDIEDLDSLDDIDEFSQTQDVEEEFYQESEEEIKQNANSDGFNEDYQRFSLIQSSVNRFYKDPKYDSKFIESIYIADGAGISPDLKKYLEEEMFLNVYVRHIDIACEISALAQEELGL
jgi:hypothetical protein